MSIESQVLLQQGLSQLPALQEVKQRPPVHSEDKLCSKAQLLESRYFPFPPPHRSRGCHWLDTHWNLMGLITGIPGVRSSPSTAKPGSLTTLHASTVNPLHVWTSKSLNLLGYPEVLRSSAIGGWRWIPTPLKRRIRSVGSGLSLLGSVITVSAGAFTTNQISGYTSDQRVEILPFRQPPVSPWLNSEPSPSLSPSGNP